MRVCMAVTVVVSAPMRMVVLMGVVGMVAVGVLLSLHAGSCVA